jgi:hypothetical protein
MLLTKADLVRFLAGLLSLLLAALLPAVATAEIPSPLVCIADDVFFVWYREAIGTAQATGQTIEPNQKLSGNRLTDPQTRMRFFSGKLYMSDGVRPEYFYGDLRSVGLDRFEAGYATLIFDQNYRTLIAVISDSLSTHLISLKCAPGGA